MPKATAAGTPDAGDPHVRCDGGQVARLPGAAPCLPYCEAKSSWGGWVDAPREWAVRKGGG